MPKWGVESALLAQELVLLARELVLLVLALLVLGDSVAGWIALPSLELQITRPSLH